RVEVDGGGVATVVWNRFDGSNWIIQTRRLSAAGLPEGSVEDLSATGRSAAEPQLALDEEGAATVVWDRFDGSSFVVQARRLDPAGDPLGSPLALSGAGRDAADPQLAIAPDGTATVLWTRFDGSQWVVQRRDLGSGGTPGAIATLSAAGRSAGDPAVAWGSDGTLSMIWKRFAGAGDVIQALTVPKPETPPPPPPPPPPPDPTAEEPTVPGGNAAPPETSFRITKVRLDRKRGTATLAVQVPAPGQLSLAGAVPRRREVDAAGVVTLRVVPKAAKRQTLRRLGSVRVRVTVRFEPADGAGGSRVLSLRLRKALPRG
ncbi:MAG TPA: hypothetical protein VFS26_05270, partial [Solirubrobacterales bacterium]|nr:hypothetical protein [Solirubrobacterales bacterium]